MGYKMLTEETLLRLLPSRPENSAVCALMMTVGEHTAEYAKGLDLGAFR